MSQSRLTSTGTVVTVVTGLAGAVIAYLTLAATVKWPPFAEPERTVVVYQGDSAVGVGNCVAAECAYVGVELRGFPADAAVRCTFDSSSGAEVFGDYVAKVDGDGSARAQTTNYFGNAGGWVSATCDGATGVRNPW